MAAGRSNKSKDKKTGSKKPTVISTGQYSPRPSIPPVPKEVVSEADVPEVEEREKLMTLGDHLEELRKRLIAILLIIIVSSIAVAFFSFEIHQLLVDPYHRLTGLNLTLGSVYGSIDAIMQLSLLAGAVISLPVCIFILWGFISPAFDRKVDRMGKIIVGTSSVLFWSGMYLSWRFILPVSLAFMFGSALLPHTQPLLALDQYYSFLFMILIAGGIIMQIPLVLVILGAIGILTVAWHKKIWKYAVVAIVIFSGIVTPPDPMSQIFMAIPLLLLYAGAVGIVWLIELSRGRNKKEI